MDDDELVDRWEPGFGRAVTHEEHVRIGRALVLRHGRVEARRRLLEGTLRNCTAMDVPERFDAALTGRWAARVADCVEADDAATFDEFIARYPDLARSDLLGLPAWRRSEIE